MLWQKHPAYPLQLIIGYTRSHSPSSIWISLPQKWPDRTRHCCYSGVVCRAIIVNTVYGNIYNFWNVVTGAGGVKLIYLFWKRGIIQNLVFPDSLWSQTVFLFKTKHNVQRYDISLDVIGLKSVLSIHKKEFNFQATYSFKERGYRVLVLISMKRLVFFSYNLHTYIWVFTYIHYTYHIIHTYNL